MAKKEAQTDIWVHELLKSAQITLSYQGSDISELDKALKTASKAGTGKVGKPEFIGVVKDFVLVIENKAETSQHAARDKDGNLLEDTASKQAYALNGSLHYAQHIIKHTSYRKVFAIGVSGDEKRHLITPIFIDDSLYSRELPNVETFVSFNEANIDYYYHREVLKETSAEEKTTAEILKDAKTLHEMLWKGGLTNQGKPLVVSGILLALREESFKGFSVDDLTGDTIRSDGQKIYDAIKANLKRADVSPETKRDKILAKFAVIRDTPKINYKDPKTQRTLLREYTEFLRTSIHGSIRYAQSADDYLGMFYGEFMSYSGEDGQSLGIILTPKHITELFCDLISLKPTDRVLDPCCGTAGFLIAAMHSMIKQTDDEVEQRAIRKKRLMGIELQDYMFTIATTNMILRGDGKSNLHNFDFLAQPASKIQKDMPCTVGMMNPPYSQGSKEDLDKYEIAFTEHLLDSLCEDARAIVIVPQSAVTGKTTVEKEIKKNILKKHTLEGVITLNTNTFYGVGTNPCIAIFTAGIPHPKQKKSKFINFEDDGFVVAKHVGLVDNGTATDRKQHLLDVWHGRTESESKFCVETTIEAEDEWLHSFYYFNDEIPSEEDFRKTMADYLTFQFNMITHGRGYLFSSSNQDVRKCKIEGSKMQPYFIEDVLFIANGVRLTKADMQEGSRPFVGASEANNGVTAFIENSNASLDSNVLGVNYKGSVGFSFYHPYEALFSDDVKRVRWKDETANNKYTLLYLSTAIAQQKGKYAYGYKFNAQRMKRQIIMLPALEDGSPDYRYMELTMRVMEYEVLSEYLKRIEV